MSIGITQDIAVRTGKGGMMLTSYRFVVDGAESELGILDLIQVGFAHLGG